MPKFIDRTGHRYGRLTVIRRVADSETLPGVPRWLCACDCGGATECSGQTLKSGASRSCGCLNRDNKRDVCLKRNTKHGLARTPTHRIWTGIRSRCNNPKASGYHKYGARGVRVCDRWQSFENFLADMGERPGNLTIDRIDNSKGYEPGNCRWATQKEQQNNRTNNRRTKLGLIIS